MWEGCVIVMRATERTPSDWEWRRRRLHVRYGSLVRKTAARKPNIYNCNRNTKLCTRKRAILKFAGEVARGVFLSPAEFSSDRSRTGLLRDHACLLNTTEQFSCWFWQYSCCTPPMQLLQLFAVSLALLRGEWRFYCRFSLQISVCIIRIFFE